MPAFSQGLEKALHQALTLANERHHEYATLEHLLLALIDDAEAAAVMRACNVDLDDLKHTVLTVIISAVTLAVAVVLPSVQVITIFTGATGEKALALAPPDCSTPGHIHGTR